MILLCRVNLMSERMQRSDAEVYQHDKKPDVSAAQQPQLHRLHNTQKH